LEKTWGVPVTLEDAALNGAPSEAAPASGDASPAAAGAATPAAAAAAAAAAAVASAFHGKRFD